MPGALSFLPTAQCMNPQGQVCRCVPNAHTQSISPRGSSRSSCGCRCPARLVRILPDRALASDWALPAPSVGASPIPDSRLTAMDASVARWVRCSGVRERQIDTRPSNTNTAGRIGMMYVRNRTTTGVQQVRHRSHTRLTQCWSGEGGDEECQGEQSQNSDHAVEVWRLQLEYTSTVSFL